MRICRLRHRNWFPRVVVSPTLSVGRDAMDLPRHWREPTHVFTMPAPAPDLFSQKDDFIKQVFALMNAERRHEFHVTTRHVERALELADELEWTPNVWLGTIIEGDSATQRLAALRETPAQVRFAHVQPNDVVPVFDVEGLHFVVVEAASEPTGFSQLEGACLGAGARLFLGPRVADAELRSARPASAAVVTPPQTQLRKR